MYYVLRSMFCCIMQLMQVSWLFICAKNRVNDRWQKLVVRLVRWQTAVRYIDEVRIYRHFALASRNRQVKCFFLHAARLSQLAANIYEIDNGWN